MLLCFYLMLHAATLQFTNQTSSLKLILRLYWSEGVEPAGEGGALAGLDPEAAFALEVTDEAFAEEEGFVAADGTDAVFEGVFEGDNEVVVDRVFAVDVDGDHGSVGGKPEVPFAAAFDKKEAFSGKEAFHEALPFGLHINAHGGTDEGGVLEEDGAAAEVYVLHVSRCSWGDTDFSGSIFSGKFIDEEVFAGEESAQATFQFGLHFDVGIHGGHSGGFDFESLICRDLDSEEAKVGFAVEMVIHIRGWLFFSVFVFFCAHWEIFLLENGLGDYCFRGRSRGPRE